MLGLKGLSPGFIIIGTALLIAGICCLSIYGASSSICSTDTKYEYDVKFTYDYTYCKDYFRTTCRKIANKSSCICTEEIKLENDIFGDVVILYQLIDFNKTSIAQEPNYIQSRDDTQLKGILNDVPSNNCQPYDYDDNKRPIAPCGAIADAMFNDTFALQDEDSNDINMTNTGLLLESDKRQFRNPPSDNLTTAFQNFSRPQSWTVNIWDLDAMNPDNNGFQNEAFIAWMRTDWEQKPVLLLNRSQPGYELGLPNGTYNVLIIYNYPPSRFNGTRVMLFATRRAVPATARDCLHSADAARALLQLGIAGVVFGTILIQMFVGLLLYGRTQTSTTQSVNDKEKEDLCNNTPGTSCDRKSLVKNEDIAKDTINNSETETAPKLSETTNNLAEDVGKEPIKNERNKTIQKTGEIEKGTPVIAQETLSKSGDVAIQNAVNDTKNKDAKISEYKPLIKKFENSDSKQTAPILEKQELEKSKLNVELDNEDYL